MRNISGSVDMLSSLPDELLIRILCLIPTEDVVTICMLSKRMMRILPWITTLDFNDSSLSYILSVIKRFSSPFKFKTFVFGVLNAYKFPYLTRFRLRLGVTWDTQCFSDCIHQWGGCCPHLKSTEIISLISFPLSRFGLKEIDLHIQVWKPGNTLLPSEIFTCETLQVSYCYW